MSAVITSTTIATPEPEYVDDRYLEQYTPFSRSQWQKMRCDGIGPKYYRPTARRCVYKLSEVRAWIEAKVQP